jgi:hypothetical protein
MSPAKVYDINTGEFVRVTNDIFAEFHRQWRDLTAKEVDFYVLRGRVTHYDLRTALDLFRAINPHIPIVYDGWVKTDVLLLVEGRPEELASPSEIR